MIFRGSFCDDEVREENVKAELVKTFTEIQAEEAETPVTDKDAVRLWQ